MQGWKARGRVGRIKVYEGRKQMGREIESGIEYHFSMREKMAMKGRQDFTTALVPFPREIKRNAREKQK